jgi:hypothetical protein
VAKSFLGFQKTYRGAIMFQRRAPGKILEQESVSGLYEVTPLLAFVFVVAMIYLLVRS